LSSTGVAALRPRGHGWRTLAYAWEDAVIKNPIPWPDGCRCAVAFTFDMDADSILHLAHHASADNRVAALSILRYGPEIAVPRIVDTYAKFGMRQTFFLPAWSMERYPAAVEAVLEGGHEVAHHGYLHEHPNALERDEEQYWLKRSIEVIVKMTGQRPRGFRAPAYRFSRHTLDLLVAEGIDYDASLMGDDIPYLLDNGGATVVELPAHYGLDDWPHYQASRDFGYMMSIKPARLATEVYREEFDAMWEFGGLWIAVWHPFLSGQLARWRATEGLIEYMHEKGGVWFATLEEISAHVRKVIADGSWTPRVDRLPYYDGPIAELGEVPPELVP
jgi:peptidoglycan/xylan/chitin deacetylase (PgdA/CDA1 family)